MSKPSNRVIGASRLVIAIFFVAVFLPVYGFLPVCAGFLGVGDRRGPIIYNQSFHKTLFIIGWEMSSSNVGKPRVPFGGWPSSRPLFYGLDLSRADIEKSPSGEQHQGDLGSETGVRNGYNPRFSR